MQIDIFLFSFFFFLAVWRCYSQALWVKKEIKKQNQKMGEIKIGLWLLQVSGFTCWLWGIVDNWGDAKSLTLFFMGLVFAGYKLYNVHLDTSKKKIEFDDFRRDAKEKRKHHSEDVKVGKELNDGK